MKNYLIIFALFVSFSLTSAQELSQRDREAIMKVFKDQENAWNEGDVDAFMEGYWRSDELVFVGASGPTYGWQNTLDNYKIRYPDRVAMGKLEFDILKLRKIDKKTVFVIGKFHLSRSIGDLEGTFTLVWKKLKGQWLIVSDHTSAES